MDNQPSVKSLEAELKLLRWHKLANESALKAAILKDKQTKRSDDVLRLLDGSKSLRLNAVIKDEKSKDLIVDEAFVIKQREYEHKNAKADRRYSLIQAERRRSIKIKAENIHMMQLRKQKLLQIEADGDAVTCEQITRKDTTINQRLTQSKTGRDESAEPPINERGESHVRHQNAILMRSQSIPAAMMGSLLQPKSVASERTKLNFTKLQSKSAPGEPSRPYYCVRVSKSENPRG